MDGRPPVEESGEGPRITSPEDWLTLAATCCAPLLPVASGTGVGGRTSSSEPLSGQSMDSMLTAPGSIAAWILSHSLQNRRLGPERERGREREVSE